MPTHKRLLLGVHKTSSLASDLIPGGDDVDTAGSVGHEPAPDDAEVGDSATGPDPETDDSVSGASGGSKRPRRAAAGPRVRLAAIISMVIACVGASGLAGFSWWKYEQQRAVDDAGQAALSAAQRYAVILTSVDNAHLDQNFAEVVNGATGEFRDMYVQASARLRQVLMDNQAGAHGVVIDSGIKSEAKNKVEVVLFVDQSVTNKANPDPRIDRNRVVMTMEKIDGRWLASKVDLP